jgi:hypothetical protein
VASTITWVKPDGSRAITSSDPRNVAVAERRKWVKDKSKPNPKKRKKVK